MRISYTHTYIHIYIYTYVHTYIHAYVHTYVYTSNTCIPYASMCIHMHPYAAVQICMPPYESVVHPYAPIYLHMCSLRTHMAAC